MIEFSLFVFLLLLLSLEPVLGQFQVCGITSNVNFKSWTSSFETDSPIVYPKNDEEVASFINQARTGGCKVRVVGTAHSFDGVVHQKRERNVLVISLAEYYPPAPWNDVLDTVKGTIRMGAGRSFLDLHSIIRPKGWLLESMTAGLFFTLGGVLMNPSVHGGTINSDRISTFSVAFRFMKSDGSIIEITDPVEVKKWRGSLGLFGVLLAVEIRLRRDTGQQLFYDETQITGTSWSKTNVETFLRNTASGKDAAEWFYDIWTDKFQAMTVRFTSPIGANGYPNSFDYTQTQAYYDNLKAQFPDMAKTSAIVSPTNALLSTINTITGDGILLAKTLATIGWNSQRDSWLANFAPGGPRDAYFVDPANIVQFDNVQQFIRCTSDCINDGTIFKALQATRNILRPITQNLLADWYPQLPIEWRIVTVDTDNLLVEHLLPGKYISFEIVSIRDTTLRKEIHAPVFAQLEAAWSALNAANSIHHGKQWGYGLIPGLPRPYAFQASKQVWSQNTQTAIKAMIALHDPIGVFSAGEASRLLGISTTNTQFTPKYYGHQTSLGNVRTSCNTFGDNDCINGCCLNDGILLSIFDPLFNKCSDRKVAGGSSCAKNCECSSGVCANNILDANFKKCVTPKPNGSRCSFDYECTSNRCALFWDFWNGLRCR